MKDVSVQRIIYPSMILSPVSRKRFPLTVLVAITLLFGMAFQAPLHAQAMKVLVLGGGASPSTADAALTNRLGILGFDVTYMDDNVATTNDAMAVDLLVTLASGNSGEYSRYKEVPVPILNTEQAAQQESRYSMVTAGRGTLNDQIEANIVGAGHPLSFGLSGIVTVFEPAQSMTFGTPEPNATVIATVAGNPDQACIYAYDAGDVMAYGFVASAARLHFMLSDNSFLGLTENGLKLFDAAALWLTGQTIPDAPPLITDISPESGASFQSAAINIGFTATTDPANTIPNTTDNIKLLLNGVDVSADLLVGGSGTNRTVSYTNDLTPNALYQVKAVVKDDSNRQSFRVWNFDTFVESAGMAIEAEDFNFDGGQYINDPELSYNFGDTNTYYGQGYLNGSNTVDFLELDPLTRPPSIYGEWRYLGVEGLPQTLENTDFVRQKYADVFQNPPDYDLVNILAGEWCNYTRDFTNSNYRIYLRALASSAQTVQLHKATSDTGMSNQTTVLLGNFNINLGGGSGYAFTPLTQPDGSATVLTLSSTQTLRLTALTANNNLKINYLLLVPTTDEATINGPYVQSVSPEAGSTSAERTSLAATLVNRETTLDTESVQLLVDDVAVTSDLVVTPTATGADISYTVSPPFEANSTHTAELRYSDNLANMFTNTWSFTTSPDAVPNFTSARVENGELKLLLAFAEQVDPTTAGTTGNYTSDQGVTFSAVSNLTDRAVELTGTPAADGQPYVLTVQNIEDTQGNVVPDTSIFYSISPFLENSNGVVTIEAESYHTNTVATNEFEGQTWTFSQDHTGYSGGGSMHAANGFPLVDVTNVSSAARMDYRVRFTQPGVHKVWIRGIESPGAEAGADSCHLGLDGVQFGAINGIAVGSFNWNDDLVPDTGANSFDIPSAGDHTINVWVREDDFYLDKIMLVLESADFDPTLVNSGLGPNQSPRVGDILVPEQPELHISMPTPTEIRLEWTGTGFHLEQTSDLGHPTWSNVTDGGSSPVTIPHTGEQMYFRLSN